jgi:hypothetical protein
MDNNEYLSPSVEIERGPTYEEFIQGMEEARLAYQSGRALFYDGIPGFALTSREKYVRAPGTILGFRPAARNIKLRDLEKSGPMPINLKAYTIAKRYDPEKRTFSKVIAELAKHKDELHPYVRRYLIERMRSAERRHLELAKAYGDIAAQFEDAPASPKTEAA